MIWTVNSFFLGFWEVPCFWGTYQSYQYWRLFFLRTAWLAVTMILKTICAYVFYRHVTLCAHIYIILFIYVYVYIHVFISILCLCVFLYVFHTSPPRCAICVSPQDADGEWTCAAGFAGEAGGWASWMQALPFVAMIFLYFFLIKYGGVRRNP